MSVSTRASASVPRNGVSPCFTSRRTEKGLLCIIQLDMPVPMAAHGPIPLHHFSTCLRFRAYLPFFGWRASVFLDRSKAGLRNKGFVLRAAPSRMYYR